MEKLRCKVGDLALVVKGSPAVRGKTLVCRVKHPPLSVFNGRMLNYKAGWVWETDFDVPGKHYDEYGRMTRHTFRVIPDSFLIPLAPGTPLEELEIDLVKPKELETT